jgi:hypothetical protein
MLQKVIYLRYNKGSRVPTSSVLDFTRQTILETNGEAIQNPGHQ